MEENLYNRIGEADLNPTYKDGQVYQHTDVNNMLSILKLAINENYYDIQRLWNGERNVGNAEQLDGATLSRYLNEELQANDNKVPSSQQVMSYINALFEDFSPPIRGVDYWTEEDKLYIVDETINRIIDEFKGEYDASAAYEKLNIVLYQGSTYFALTETTGNLPTDTDYWQLLAKRGDSAYETYVKHGGTLPEDVWIDEFTNAENFYNKTEVDNKLSLRDLLINQKPYYFNTVAEMKAYDLNNGDVVITLGYHSKNDGGCALYKIRTITSSDTIDESFIISLQSNNLIAELVIDDNIDVKKLGAYGDNTHDDTEIFEIMLDKLGKLVVNSGTYKISETLTISNKKIDIKGSINYTGEDYFLLIKQLTYSNIYIETFNSTNGGMIKIYPDVNGYVSFTNIYCKYAYCNKEVVRADATKGVITTMILDGIRWHSTISGVIKLYIGENAESSAFLTEINIKNMDLWSPLFGVDAENLSNNVEIQFNVYELDIENCKGIQTTGKITALGIYNCRLFEATGKAGWLTFNNLSPDFCTIQGNGFIYPSKIIWNNVTNSKPIITNMTIIDEISTYNYEGGGLLRKGSIEPAIKKQVWKNFTDEIVNHIYTHSNNKLGNLYNYFQTSTNEWLEFHFPNSNNYREFYFQTSNAIGVTFTNGTAGKTVDLTNGIYKIYIIGNIIMYTKLT